MKGQRVLSPWGALLLAACHPLPDGSVGKLRPGHTAPLFDLPTIVPSAPRIDLQKLRGDVVLLDFWATFCDPCEKSLPGIEALASKYQGRGLHVIGISEDEPAEVEAIAPFVATYRVTFPVVWDVSHAVGGSYHLGAFPCTVVIDRRGVVRYVRTGYKRGDDLALEKAIVQLLKSD